MQETSALQFLGRSETIAFDRDHRRKLAFNIAQYDKTVDKGRLQFANAELARQRAALQKQRALESLDKHLVDFEAAFTRRGGKVIWAQDDAEARAAILEILKEAGATSVVKSKSMTTEELHLNDFLAANGVEAVETDLGEYIVQLAGETPYHIVTPAMHKSKEDVARLFHEKEGLPEGSSPQEVTAHVRKRLRGKYRSAGAGITGANFIIADSGAIALTENEGNAWLTMAFPKVHIAIAGIEKVIPSLSDLPLFWPLLATHGTGQKMTVFNHIVSGPRQAGEADGPEAMYVILLDNGRTNLLARREQRQALQCIRCGACLNACPVYKNVGGHTYGTTYSGPIGSVITPHFRGMEQFRHLSFASSLCGRCTEVCPVKIDIHKLLVINRRDAQRQFPDKGVNKWAIYLWKKAALSRKAMERGGAAFKNLVLRRALKGSWGKRRDVPAVAAKSFYRLWRERKMQ